MFLTYIGHSKFCFFLTGTVLEFFCESQMLMIWL